MFYILQGRVKVYATNLRQQPVLSKVPNERICIRCGKPYMVDLQGLAIQPQNCIYHWGRKFTFRGESKYSCCQQYGSADGCCDAKTHVWDYTDYENLRGYIKTLPRSKAPLTFDCFNTSKLITNCLCYIQLLVLKNKVFTRLIVKCVILHTA